MKGSYSAVWSLPHLPAPLKWPFRIQKWTFRIRVQSVYSTSPVCRQKSACTTQNLACPDAPAGGNTPALRHPSRCFGLALVGWQFCQHTLGLRMIKKKKTILTWGIELVGDWDQGVQAVELVQSVGHNIWIICIDSFVTSKCHSSI